MERDNRFDNVRGLLMILVVFGHLIGIFALNGRVYQILYTFHMPAFIFISGRFARQSHKGFFRLLIFYLLSQFADFFFFRASFPEWTFALGVQITEPYMFQWYLMSLMWYMLLFPIIRFEKWWQRILALTVAVGIAIAAGFDNTVGYSLSLSRTLVYLPFFMAGVYAKDLKRPVPAGRAVIGLAAAGIATLGVYYALNNPVPYSFLYGAEAYSHYGPELVQSAMTRGLYMVFAAAWICMLLMAAPHKKIPLLAWIGRNTLPVFLLHIYAVALIFKFYKPEFPLWQCYLFAFGAAVVISAILSLIPSRPGMNLLPIFLVLICVVSPFIRQEKLPLPVWGSYALTFIAAGVLSAIAAVTLLLIRKKRPV